MITPVMPTYARTDLSFEKGNGVRLQTGDGTEYIDFGSGIAVNVLGHCHPHLVETLKNQVESPWHVSNLYRIPDGERLAARLVEATFADTVFFTNSGAEALECAIKMMRKYHSATDNPERYRIITFEGAFHGRTLATLAAGRQEKHLEGFGPIVDGFDQVAFGDVAALKQAITSETAGILLEPVQGEGGIRPFANDFMKAVRQVCDEAGILLALDEVQCGVGRTGKLFAHEWAGITPDIMSIAKAIGGGFPMGACLATASAAQGMTAGTHGSTFGGNPLAMAVGNAVLDVVLADGFLDRVNQMALKLNQKLARLKDEYPDVIEDVRGSGLMLGLKCRVPNTELSAACLDQHLLTVGAGDNVLRMLPPLVISEADLDDAIGRLENACMACSADARQQASA